jgi:hypothetical protein
MATNRFLGDLQKHAELQSDTRPSLLLDFVNSKSIGAMTKFERTSTATYYDGKTKIKTEQNLVVASNGFDVEVMPESGISGWSVIGTATLNSNTAVSPSGFSDAFTLSDGADTDGLEHGYYIEQDTRANMGKITWSIYAKSAAGAANIVLKVKNISNQNRAASAFNLSTGESRDLGTTSSAEHFGSGIEDVGDGWYRCWLTADIKGNPTRVYAYLNDDYNGTPSESYLDIDFVATNGSKAVYIYGAQLEEEIGSMASEVTPLPYLKTTDLPLTNWTPVLQTAAIDEPRFDHNPITGECKGLLMESARTNKSVQSSNLNSLTKQTGGTAVKTNQHYAPDGTFTADKLTEGTVNGLHRIYEFLTFSAGDEVTFSVFAKAAERSRVSLATSGVGWVGAEAYVSFDLLNGTVLSATDTHGALLDYGIVSVGGGWHRVYLTVEKPNNDSGTIPIDIVNDGEIEYGTYQGNGKSGIYLWGAQTEIGAHMSSYIPTDGTEVTRLGEACYIDGRDFRHFYNDNEGTLYAEYFQDNNAATAFITSINYDQTGSYNRMYMISRKDEEGSFTQWHRNFNSIDIKGDMTTWPKNHKIAHTYNAGLSNSLFYKDGKSIGTGRYIDTYYNRLDIGSSYPGKQFPRNGCIKKVAYYPTSLSAAQLQSITEE